MSPFKMRCYIGMNVECMLRNIPFLVWRNINFLTMRFKLTYTILKRLYK